MSFQIATVQINAAQNVAWLSSTISFINSQLNYTGQLYGLMGNYNGISDDDIVSRTGTYSTDMSESSIYNTAITCNFNLIIKFDLIYINEEKSSFNLIRGLEFN
jgi:hypothetical protein